MTNVGTDGYRAAFFRWFARTERFRQEEIQGADTRELIAIDAAAYQVAHVLVYSLGRHVRLDEVVGVGLARNDSDVGNVALVAAASGAECNERHDGGVGVGAVVAPVLGVGRRARERGRERARYWNGVERRRGRLGVHHRSGGRGRRLDADRDAHWREALAHQARPVLHEWRWARSSRAAASDSRSHTQSGLAETRCRYERREGKCACVMARSPDILEQPLCQRWQAPWDRCGVRRYAA